MNKKSKIIIFIVIIIISIFIIYGTFNLLFSTPDYDNNIPFDEPLRKTPDEIASDLAFVVGTEIESHSSEKRSPSDFDRFNGKEYFEDIYNCSNNGSIHIWTTEDNSLISIRYDSNIGYLDHTKNITLSEKELKDKALKFLQNFGITIDLTCTYEIELNNDDASGDIMIIQTYKNKIITNYNRVYSFIRFDYDNEYNLIRNLEINNWYDFPDDISFDVSADEAYKISAEYLRDKKENPYWNEKKIEYYSVIDHKLCYLVTLYHYEERYYASGDYYDIHVDVQSGEVLKFEHSMLT